jgi:hypothetical protein
MTRWYGANLTVLPVDEVEDSLREKMKKAAGNRNWLLWHEIYEIGYSLYICYKEDGKLKDYEKVLCRIFTQQGDRWYFN